jgi:D-arabinose 1-dehydrogenase-like Zn-dependent alcohol dehydrogenase
MLLLLHIQSHIQGIGGLGHLGIQFAAKMGYTVVAISRGTAKQELAMELGAHHYIGKYKLDILSYVLCIHTFIVDKYAHRTICS